MVIPICLQLKRRQCVKSVQSCPKNDTIRTCAVYRTPSIINVHATPAGVEIAMKSSAGRTEFQPPTLPDPRRCPGRSQFPGRLDPVVTKAAHNGSDPMMTAAGNATVLQSNTVTIIVVVERKIKLKKNLIKNI